MKKENWPKITQEKGGMITVIEGYNNITFKQKDVFNNYVFQKKGDYQDVCYLKDYYIVIKIQDGKLFDYIINDK